MVTTRSITPASALNHVLSEALGAGGADAPMRLAIVAAGAETITDFMELTRSDLAEVTFNVDDREQRLTIVQRNKLLAVQAWYHSLPTPSLSSWFDLNAIVFDAFRNQQALPPAAGIPQANPPPDTGAGASTSDSIVVSPPAKVPSAADEFAKGTKRSVDAYKDFKDFKQWNIWHRHLRAVGRLHGLDKVFDSNYIPSNDDDKALFKMQQDFAFSVLTTHVLESRGLLIVRKYSEFDKNPELYGDAQKIYAELVAEYQEGTTAFLTADALEQSILTFTLDSKWNKGVVTFLTSFRHKLMDYDNVLSSAMDDKWKCNRLHAALCPHKEMNSHVSSLNIQAKAIALQTGTALKTLPYEEFYATLLDYAKSIDKTNADLAKQQRASHQTERLTNNNSRQSGRGNGNHGGSGGRGDNRTNNSGGRGGNFQSTSSSWIAPDKWNKMSAAERDAHKAKHRANKDGKSTQPSSGTTTTTSVPAAVQINTSDVQSTITVPTTTAPTTPGGVLRQMLSHSSAHSTTTDMSANAPINEIEINGHRYWYFQGVHKLTYHICHFDVDVAASKGALIDGGANGGMSGDDVRVIEQTSVTADVTGLADHKVTNLPISTVAAVLQTTTGPVVGIFHQYAHHGMGKTVHSIPQLRSFGLSVDDSSRKHGGSQRILTPDGYVIPLHIRDGLAYMDMHPPSDDEYSSLPHVFMTSDVPWDPTSLDNEFDDADINCPMPDDFAFIDPRINDYGEIMPPLLDHDLYVDQCIRTVRALQVTASKHAVKPKGPTLEALRPHFGWVPLDRIKKTLENTTQFFRASVSHPFRKHFKSHFPAANVRHLNEWFATDTFFSDTPAHDDGILGHGGATMLQLFAGKESSFLAGYPMREEGQMPHTFEDFIRDHGAPIGLFSDNAKTQIGKAVKTIERMYCISDAQCEPHHQHQNYAERRIQDVKRLTNNIMDRTGTPPQLWLLCTMFVIYLLNHLANDLGIIPLTACFGVMADVSALLSFHWWQPVYYAVDNDFPSQSPEKLGRWVGIAEKQGDALTYLILTNDTLQVIPRSAVRPAADSMFPNARAPANSKLTGGEPTKSGNIYSVADQLGVDPVDLKLPLFSPEELIGLTFLLDEEDGQTFRAKVGKKINDKDADNHQKIKFLIQVGDEERGYEEIMAYNELSDLIERQHEAEVNGELQAWAFKGIAGHQGPLKVGNPLYKGSSYNVLVQWEDGSQTYEPLTIMIKDDPITCARYAVDNGLLETAGWKSLKRIASREKIFKRMLQQSKLKSQRRGICYKFGVRVPRNYKEAIMLDQQNGDTLWKDAIDTEMDQVVHEYKTFKDLGPNAKPPDGYKRINVHLIFDVKQTLKRKARLVAGGHMTDPPKDSVYSGVVSLRSLRIITFLAELNGLELMAADIGNAYLEAHTKEKVYCIAGSEFGELAGHVLVFNKALYGLRTSDARFHERLADTLRDLGFTPSLADPDVWIHDAGDVWEYVCTYVDDLLVAMKNAKEFMDRLQSEPWNYKLKGIEEPKYHLGGDFFRDKDGTLCYGAQTYIKRMISNYKTMFGDKPREYVSPLEDKDHPELDLSEFCNEDDIEKFQSLIGALQWTISLCRFDIANAVMTLSRYRAAPRIGHLDRAKRICGYLRKYSHGAIRFRTGIPSHAEQAHKIQEYDWFYTVYGNPTEEISPSLPVPKGKPVRLTTFVDANLMHDLTTGRSATGILHFLNQTPIDWFSKRQNTVETATYGSEYNAARSGTDQVIDLRFTMRAFGVPIDGRTWMFGDNESVITSSTIPHSVLKKRHNALSYHRVREAIAANIMHFLHLDGSENCADVLTKIQSHTKIWPLIEPLLFWKGETRK